MYKVKITDAKKGYIPEFDQHQLEVSYEVTDGDTIVSSGTHGFPMDTPPEVIDAELEKLATTLKSDKEVADKSRPLEELNAKADETINTLLTEEQEIKTPKK